ncbi:unnamed protein product [Protopolystoma xenopodis]|uniref:Uncharacterized protein n=1 Tax=Protopolystoma xenopodis TaxID=117903 RepID=A0A3S5ANH0_9PLAT|nr:unnamed protein product [Protopolystoma xenopodis]
MFYLYLAPLFSPQQYVLACVEDITYHLVRVAGRPLDRLDSIKPVGASVPAPPLSTPLKASSLSLAADFEHSFSSGRQSRLGCWPLSASDSLLAAPISGISVSVGHNNVEYIPTVKISTSNNIAISNNLANPVHNSFDQSSLPTCDSTQSPLLKTRRTTNESTPDSFVRLVGLHLSLDAGIQPYVHLGQPMTTAHIAQHTNRVAPCSNGNLFKDIPSLDVTAAEKEGETSKNRLGVDGSSTKWSPGSEYESTGSSSKLHLIVYYHDAIGILDFIILKSVFDKSLRHNWNPGD